MEVDGINTADADLKTSHATIVIAPGKSVTQKTIRDAVTKAGTEYSVTSIVQKQS